MCHSGSRCVRDRGPWRWILQQNQALELLGGEMGVSSFGGSGGRRGPSKKKAEKTVLNFNVIFVYQRVFFVIWRCTVLNL
ncbi:unnamed protein product [Urochloa humidicola]